MFSWGVNVAHKTGNQQTLSYSFDDSRFINLRDPFTTKKGRWIGAIVGLFCTNPNINESKSYATFDWFRVE